MFVKTLPHHVCFTSPNPIFFEQSLVWKIGLISGFSASLFLKLNSTILAMAMMQTMQSQDLGQLLQRLSPQEFFLHLIYIAQMRWKYGFVYLHKVNNGHIPGEM